MSNNNYCEYHHGNGKCLTGYNCYIANMPEKTTEETKKELVEKCALRNVVKKMIIGIANNKLETKVK